MCCAPHSLRLRSAPSPRGEGFIGNKLRPLFEKTCKANFQTKKKSKLFFITAATRQSKPPKLPLSGSLAKKAPRGEA